MTEKREEYECYSDDVKQAAKLIWHLGRNLKKIHKVLDVPVSTLRTWRTRYKWGKQEPKSRAEKMAAKIYPEYVYDWGAARQAYIAGYKQGQEDCN